MRTAVDLTRTPQFPASGSEKGFLPSLAHPWGGRKVVHPALTPGFEVSGRHRY